jgi:hypothetical protein
VPRIGESCGARQEPLVQHLNGERSRDLVGASCRGNASSQARAELTKRGG